MKKVWHFFLGTNFRKGATLLSILTFFSYALGLLRDRIFAHTFGASRTLDIYNAAFIIPDLLLNILVASALTAAFIPVFTHIWSTENHEEANRLATTMLTAAFFAIFTIGIVMFFLMPWVTNVIAPGFSPEDKKMLTDVSRVMLISPLVFALSNTLGNILVSYERFVAYGISPILYNIGIISGAWFAKEYGIFGLAMGTLLGSGLHLAIRVVDLSKTQFKLTFPVKFRSENFKKILKLMIPKMIGQPVEQLTFLVFTSIASSMAAGSIAMMNYGRNFQSVPVSLFGIAFSTAVFSSLSQKIAKHDKAGFKRHFWETAKWLLTATSLSAVFYFFFGELVIRILLGGGKFTNDDIATTGRILAIFAFSIPAESIIHLLARSFYAFKDTLTTVIVAVAGLGIIIAMAKWLTPNIGIVALPLSYSAGLLFEALLLGFLLYRRYQSWKV